ncbi:MAG: PAS domain S-box protein [Nitrospira sp.]|nr:PAS domain S-box protein [Nitrospira sp.]
MQRLSQAHFSGAGRDAAPQLQEDDLFAEAFRRSSHPIGITDLETGICLEINDAWLATLGARRDEVIGKTTVMWEIWPDPQDRAKFIDRLKSEGSVQNLDVSMRMKSGGLRQFLISTDLITLRGKPCLLTIGHDITERKRNVTARVETQNALHEREERSDQVIRLAHFGIVDHDHRTGKVYWSPVMREIYGVRPDEPASMEGYIQLIHPEDREAVVTAIKQAHDPSGDDLFSLEHRLLYPHGGVRWVSFRSWTLFDNDGSERRPARTLGAMIDITRRKHAEEALRMSERQFASFMDNLHGFAWIKDAEGRYLYVNRLFEESALNGLDWKEKTARDL